MKVLHKPKGEAGDRKNGFNLREAMGLEGEEGKSEYLAIVVRRCLLLSRHTLTRLPALRGCASEICSHVDRSSLHQTRG
jgi:hypothetical protein